MSGHWISAPAQIRSLAKAVSAAFAASNLEPEEKAPGKIEITDLPWQAPPIICESLLVGAPLHDYLDVPIALDEARLHRFWTATLQDIWHAPSRLMRRGALANCGVYMPKVKIGQRALHFSCPPGWPAQIDESAGVMFSLEVAHAARCSVAIKDVVSDDDNYYVVMPNGERIGVQNGRPACDSAWTASYRGGVQDLLTMPRGETDYSCRFDQIALLRSVLNVHRKRFPKNFDALDTALQALRLLTLGAHCPELSQEMYVAPVDMAILKGKERALRDCLELMPEMMSDRSKLQVLHSLLVPSVLPAALFKRFIYSGAVYPFSLATGKLQQIEAWLLQEYESKIPAEVRQFRSSK